MKTSLLISLGSAAAVAFLAGCASTPKDTSVERGPHGTIAYDVFIEASAPGARIEANGQMLGVAPLHLKIFGDKDGTFHDFGSYYYVIKAFPITTNQFPQTKYFGTGRHDAQEDHIPSHLYFDLSQPQPNQDPPVVYEQPRVYYYGAPYPYYYGPGVNFYFHDGGGRRHW